MPSNISIFEGDVPRAGDEGDGKWDIVPRRDDIEADNTWQHSHTHGIIKL